MKKISKEEYLKRLEEINDKFIYELDDKVNSRTRIKIICPEHGEFDKRLNEILNKNKVVCPKCSMLSTKYNQSIEEKIELCKEKFPEADFSLFKPNNTSEKSTIICKKHGISEKSISRLLDKKINYFCKECSIESLKNQKYTNSEIYINELKELYPEFDFSKYEYNGCMEKSIVICPIHGEFLTSRDKLLVRKRTNKKVYGCPSCNKINKSSYEDEITNFIKENTNLEIIRNDRKVIYPKEIDIYLPEIKLGIEFNGTYWHSDDFIAKYDINFNTAKEKHDYKTELCKSKGIKLIHISEEEYINNKNYVLNNILSQLI